MCTELGPFFQSVIDMDRAAVVICNLNHTILYMNPAAEKNYEKYGGAKLLGCSLLNCHNERSQETIRRVVNWFSEDTEHNILFGYHNARQNKDVYMVALRDDQKKLIGYYEKHEYRTPETGETCLRMTEI